MDMSLLHVCFSLIKKGDGRALAGWSRARSVVFLSSMQHAPVVPHGLCQPSFLCFRMGFERAACSRFLVLFYGLCMQMDAFTVLFSPIGLQVFSLNMIREDKLLQNYT